MIARDATSDEGDYWYFHRVTHWERETDIPIDTRGDLDNKCLSTKLESEHEFEPNFIFIKFTFNDLGELKIQTTSSAIAKVNFLSFAHAYASTRSLSYWLICLYKRSNICFTWKWYWWNSRPCSRDRTFDGKSRNDKTVLLVDDCAL